MQENHQSPGFFASCGGKGTAEPDPFLLFGGMKSGLKGILYVARFDDDHAADITLFLSFHITSRVISDDLSEYRLLGPIQFYPL